MRAALGDGYVDALRGVWPAVPESADFVMFWWHHAAQLVAQGRLARFGFITTNSLRQTFNRRVVQAALQPAERASTGSARTAPDSVRTEPVEVRPIHLAFAIPDHPWVDNADGAAVRIAMTVAAPGAGEGRLCIVTAEREGRGEGLEVELAECGGEIHADLKVGADVTAAQACARTKTWHQFEGSSCMARVSSSRPKRRHVSKPTRLSSPTAMAATSPTGRVA
jgi:hypothetical protein